MPLSNLNLSRCYLFILRVALGIRYAYARTAAILRAVKGQWDENAPSKFNSIQYSISFFTHVMTAVKYYYS